MKILIIEPRKHPRRAEIPHTLEEMQRVVGGDIEATYPFDDPVAIVNDGESKIKGYELNRYIPNADIIAGTFFVCGLGKEDFADLPDDLAEKYEKFFYEPEVFVRAVNCILILRADGMREVIR